MSLFYLYRLNLWVIFTYVLSPFSHIYARSTAPYENPFGPNTEFIVEEGSFETDSMDSNKRHTSSKEHVIVRRGATSLYPCSNLSDREKMLSVPQHCPGTGDLPIPNECRVFLHCITEGVAPILGCCPQGYHFDHKFLHCIPEARALCTDEDLAHARDVVVDYPDSTSDSDDYQEASSNSQEPSFDPRSWSPDNLESSPDTSQKQQWQYYPAPDNLFPQAFWSRNPYTGHMWPARFGYAIPISVSYSSIPIRIKRHKKGHGGTHGGNNFKENSTSSSSTLPPPSPSPPTTSTKKPKPPPPPPTSTSITTSTTTSTTTPKPKPKPTTTHVTTTQKPKPSSSSTTTKKSEGGSDEGFQQVGSNEIDSAEEAMATMATSSKPSSNSFSGNSNEGSDEGFTKVTSSENQTSNKLNGNKLYAKPGSRKGNPPPIIGFPAEPRKFHVDDDDDSKEKKRHANLKPKKRQQAAKPQSVAIINPKPTNEKYESVKSGGGGWKPEFGGESEEDPIGGGIIPLPGINDNGSLKRKRKRQAIYYSSEEDRDEEVTARPKKKRRNRRHISV